MTDCHDDKLIISPIPLTTIIGILPHEKTTEQILLLHLTLFVDTPPAAHSDLIQDTVDYGNVVQEIKAKAESCRVNLIETLAEKIAQWLLEDRRIKKVKVKLDKPQIFNASPNISVEITRSGTPSQ